MNSKSCDIEKLPEDIILHILRFLPLVDAVATKTLSRTWKNLSEKSCSQRSNLCFDVDNIIKFGNPVPEGKKKKGFPGMANSEKVRLVNGHIYGMSSKIIENFTKGVDMIVQCRRREEHPLGVKSLEIRFPLRGIHSHHIDSWISSIVTSDTEQLILALNIPSDLPSSYIHSLCYQLDFEMLPNYKSMSLKHLHLEFISVRLPQNMDGFTALRTVKLNDILITQEDVHKLLINCHLLEFLELQECPRLFALQVSSPLPSLKVLIMIECIQLRRIELRAENLLTLECGTSARIDHIMLKGCHNLTRFAASYRNHDDDDYSRPLSEDFPFLTELYLNSNLKNLRLVLTGNIFAHLKFLAMFFFLEHGEKVIQDLPSLFVAPMLEELELHVCKPRNGTSYKTNNVRKIVADPFTRLKRVLFTGFTGETGQATLAKYFLKKARSLQIMTIHPFKREYENFGSIKYKGYYSTDIDTRAWNAYQRLLEAAPEHAKLVWLETLN